MRDMLKLTAAAAICAALTAAPALADDHVDGDRGWEFRLGATAHDLSDNVEAGPNVTLDLLAPSPDFLAPIWSPRPYAYWSINTQGLTNFGGTGLAWDFGLTDNLNFEFRTGLTYNDGVKDLPEGSAPDDPLRLRLADERALLGSHWLFHNALGLDYDLNEQWGVGVYYEHISHGQILASGRNQALDNAGVRFSYRFGGR